MMVSAFFWIALTCCFQIISGNEPAIIHTNLGDIQGYETDMARVFYGIPFAQPPVDTLRWQPSVPVGKWAPQVLNATIPAPACPQSPSCTPSIVCPTITLKRFPPDKSGDQRSLLSSIATEWVFVCSTRVFARKTPSYSYVFRYPLDFNAWENMSYCNNHACHAVELPFLFETAWPNTTDTGRWLSKSMATYWTNFAKTQDPNKPEIVRVEWPRTIIGNEKYIYFQNPIQIEANYMKDDCDFWDTIGYKVHDF
ncbi:unnamed protein product [Rotaria sordida]|uniref:Carboxylesterase type B domain-containing protein n=1 Tax=Rotaria sordida TaxID=392033 RepID=A0A815M119_9BILA|nr:unnamed protein product [Rotaria sordida]